MKQEFKTPMKLFAFVMALLMLLVSLPVSAIASAISTSSNEGTSTNVNADNETVKKDVIVLEEDETLRDENTKHFKLSDGTTKAVVYSQAVHYKDADGKWVDIDNALTLNGSEYSSSNKQSIKFANKSGSNGLVSIKDGDYKIDFTPLNTNKVSVVIENPQNNNSRKFEDISVLDNLVSKAIYADIYDGIDIEYILVGNNIKENIIVKEKQDSYTFSFELKLNKLSAELVNGVVILSDYVSGEQVYEIPVPYMYDANNVYSNNVEYSLVQNNKWKYTFTVTADAEWINSDDRELPVTIDPAIGVSRNDIVCFYETEGYVTQGGMVMHAGDLSRIYFKLASLPDLPNSAYITNASINMYCTSATATYIGVYKILSDWSASTINPNSINTVGLFDENPSSFVYIEDAAEWNKQLCTWNVVDIVRGWYNGDSINYGVGFNTINDTYSSATFASMTYDTVSTRPMFTIEYSDLKGVEPYWTYISQNVGFAGTGAVNLTTGNLMFEISTLTTSENIFGYTPSMIYNSAIAGEEYKYGGVQNGYWYSFAANGFKLNMNETLIKKTYINADAETAYYYVWADSDGTEHYFLQSTLTDEENIYYDEDGLQLKLVVDLVDDNNELYCKIVDSSHNERIFYILGGAPASEGLAVYHLEQLKDKNGNVLHFMMDGSHKPNDIKFTPSGTIQTTQLLGPLYNSSGKVGLVWCNETKEGVLFRHSDTPTGELNPTGGIYLREALYLKCDSNISWRNVLSEFISDYDNEYDGITVCALAKYEYDENGNLVSARDVFSGYKVEYTYSNDKVVKIKEYGNDNVQGQTVGVYYTSEQTIVRTSGTDDVYNNSDDTQTVYVHDYRGRVISVYSTDVEFKQVYGAQMGTYNDENENAKNSIKISATTGSSSANYILNGNFEDQTSTFNYWTKTGNVFESNSLSSWSWNAKKVYMNVEKNGQASISQQVKLFPGEYCLAVNIVYASDNNALLTLKAVNVDNQNSEIESFTVTNNTNYVYMPFTVNGESGTLQTINIVLETSCPNGPADNSEIAQMFLDNIMLSKSTGAQDYNYVLNGSFDQFTTQELSSNNIWILGENAEIVQHQNEFDRPFGQSLAINGEIGEVKTVEQTVISVPENYFILASSYKFIVSGFGKAPNAVKSDNSIFAIRVDATFTLGTGITYKQSQYLDFKTGIDGWQYVGGVLEFKVQNEETGEWETREDARISEIKLVCEYSNNYGIAYFDNIVFEVDNGEKTTSNYYYDDGKLKGTRKGNKTQAYIYDENGNLTSSISKKSMTKYLYDSKNNVIEEEYYTHNTLFNPENEGTYNKVSANAKLKSITTYVYDYSTNESGQGYGFLVSSTTQSADESENISTSYEYETTINSKIFGALLISTDSLGRSTNYFYNNKNGYLIAVIESDGTGLYYTYDEIGNLVMVQPATYSSSNAQKVDNSAQIEYEYDEASRIEKIIANGTEYSFTYDAFGNQSSISVGNTKLVEIIETNDYNGKITKEKYADGTEVSYEYDTLERLSKVTYINGEDIKEYTYVYDTNNNLVMFTDGNSNTTEIYRYDANGNLVYCVEYNTDTLADIKESRYTYDDESRLTFDYHYFDYVYHDAGEESIDDLTVKYHYTYSQVDGYLTGVDIEYETFYVYDHNPISLRYEYDEFNRFTNKTLYTTLGNVENKIEFQYLTQNNNTSGIINQYKSTIEIEGEDVYVDVFNYTYDDSLNITEIKNGADTLYKYTYDSLDRLVKEENLVLNKQYEYTYDNNGNILVAKEYSIGNSSSLTLVKEATYTYSTGDWKDQLVSYTITDYSTNSGTAITYQIEYDSVGNPLKAYTNGNEQNPEYELIWDNIRELTAFVGNGNTVTYEYDGNGIRTSKTVNGIKHTYVVEGSRILSETYGDVFLIYLYDENGAPVGFSYRKANEEKDVFEYFFFTKNLQGDITAIYKEDGTRVASYSYDAWGNHTVTNYTSNNIGNINPFRYRGYYYDSETNFYYLNSRYYSPEIKRFINADIYITTGQGLNSFNMYAYCGNNPVMHVDPTGNAWWHWAIGAAIVVACAVATVVTCGGFAAAAGAVCLVASGVAAATTASTVAAAALIGSAAVYGVAVVTAIANSSSVDDFAEQGSWETVVATAGGALAGGIAGYEMAKSQIPSNLDGTQETFLPDSFYSKHAPKQSTPYSSYTNYTYNNYTNKYEKSTAYYDVAGRQSIRIDWTNHGYSNHGYPHIHYTIYNSQYRDGITIRWD